MKSYYWIKLYHEILDDAKMGRLEDRLWRRAIELFLMAGEEHNAGHLPCLADMAWRLRLDDEALLEDLRALEQIDIVMQLDDGSWFVTHFADRQGAMSDAERQQRYRERQHKAQYYGNDTDNDTVTTCNVDVDVDVDKDVDRDVDVDGANDNVFTHYQAAGGVLTALTADKLNDLVDEFEEHRYTIPPPAPGSGETGEVWVKAAIEEAAESATRGISVKYVAAILDRWKREGFKAPFKPNNGRDTQAKSLEAIEQWEL